MFRTIASRIKRDPDYPDRQFTLDVYNRVLEGALYDHLPHGFQEEQNRAGEYVPLRDRRPSVRYNLARLVVDDSVSLLFSEGHFPTPDIQTGSQDPDAKQEIRQALLALMKEARLNEVMLEAATMGSVGSVAIQMRVLKQGDDSNRIFFEAKPTGFLTPTFDPANPDRLLKMTERYKVQGASLRAAGYDIDVAKSRSWYWFVREWDEAAETWFQPALVSDRAAQPAVDATKTVAHTLGFCPWVWVRNLPGKLKLVVTDADADLRFSDIDGACTFAAAIDAMVEVEYQLSQAGRGLKYSMDPLLLLKEPAAPMATDGGEMVKTPGTALVVDKDGDAKLLELGGSAFQVVLEYVRALRELALETTHGNRADSQKLSAAQSGRAMELMNQALIWLADRLRVSYGEGALLKLLKMAVAAHAQYPLTVQSAVMPKIDPAMTLSLNWPPWYSPTASDRQSVATTLKIHGEAGHMSRLTGVKTIAADYDIEDVDAEMALIEADRKSLVADVPEKALKVQDNI